MKPSCKALFVQLYCMISLASTVGFSSLLPVLKSHRHALLRSTSVTADQSVTQAPRRPLVALTREKLKNIDLERILLSKGINTITLPCISHDVGPDSALLPTYLLNDWSYVVVTSPQAATTLLEGWREAGSPKIRTASIGDRTSSTLIEGGIVPIFEASTANADTLARELPKINTNQPMCVLYPTSSRATNTLVEILKGRGFEVNRLDCYTSDPVKWDHAMTQKAKEVSLVTFGSPSAVKAWLSNVGGHLSANMPVVCIGKTTAIAAKECGFQCVSYPDRPGLSEWAQLVEDKINQQQQQIQ